MPFIRTGGNELDEYAGSTTITPSVSDIVLPTKDTIVNSDIKINGDADLVAGNILNGKSIFGVTGNVRKFGTTDGTGENASYYTYRTIQNQTVYMYALYPYQGFSPSIYTVALFGSAGSALSSYLNGLISCHGYGNTFIQPTYDLSGLTIDNNTITGCSIGDGRVQQYYRYCVAGYY